MSGSLPIAVNPTTVELMSVMPTRVSVAHSLKRQARSSGAQRWSLSFRYGQLSRAVMMQFYAFLLSVRGQSDTFTTVLPGHTAPLGSWAGTPLVSGASQTGNSINLQGFTASQTGVAKAGDLLQFSGHTKVYMVTADANSSGTGTATLNIQPALLMSPANLESIVTSYVPFTVALASDNADLGVQAGPLYGLNIDMVEVY